MPIFRVKSVKIYTGQKKFTREFSWLSWQIWGMGFMRRLSQLTRVKIDQDQVSVNILYNERKRFFPQYKSFCYAWHRLIGDIFLSIFGWCDIYQIFVAETDVDIFSNILIDIFKMHLNLTKNPHTFSWKITATKLDIVVTEGGRNWWRVLEKEDWDRDFTEETSAHLNLHKTKGNKQPPPQEKNFLDDFNHSK